MRDDGRGARKARGKSLNSKPKSQKPMRPWGGGGEEKSERERERKGWLSHSHICANKVLDVASLMSVSTCVPTELFGPGSSSLRIERPSSFHPIGSSALRAWRTLGSGKFGLC